MSSQYIAGYLSITLPMGIFNVAGSLQNIESARAAGDTFPTRSSLVVNGIGSILASFLGECYFLPSGFGIVSHSKESRNDTLAIFQVYLYRL